MPKSPRAPKKMLLKETIISALLSSCGRWSASSPLYARWKTAPSSMERSGTRSDGRGTPSRTRLPYRHFVRLRYQSCVENLELLKAIEFDDETRSEIRATIELLERWLKVRRRALGEGKPIPLYYWNDESVIKGYELSGPKELSDREREAVSLYAGRPYKPQRRGCNPCPPTKSCVRSNRSWGLPNRSYDGRKGGRKTRRSRRASMMGRRLPEK